MAKWECLLGEGRRMLPPERHDIDSMPASCAGSCLWIYGVHAVNDNVDSSSEMRIRQKRWGQVLALERHSSLVRST